MHCTVQRSAIDVLFYRIGIASSLLLALLTQRYSPLPYIPSIYDPVTIRASNCSNEAEPESQLEGNAAISFV
jgi:hypothetical protein